ncbi:hypothetical protein Tco_1192608 [Tanacetum coccineum]
MGQMAEALQESPLGVLPSNTITDPRAELKAITAMDGLTLDGSFIPHSNFLVYQEKEQEPETITEVVEIFNSQSTPLNPTGRVDHFVYETDIIDSLCDKFPIQSNESSGNYEAFCFDIVHQEEKSSGSTTSQFDHSLPEYKSFYLDLLIDPLHPTERIDSHHEEFADELAHIISPPEYDYFLFDIEVDPGELTKLLIENSSSKNVNLTEIKEDNELKPKTSTKELTIYDLNDLHLLLSNCDSTFSEEFSEIEFLVSFPFENKDKIFDPGIFIIKGVFSKRSHILPWNDFSPISFISDLLTDPSKIETFLSFPFGNEEKVFDLGILLIDGVLSFTRKTLLQ